MILSEFLKEHETEILSLTRSKAHRLAGALSFSKKMEEGLPKFYKCLITALEDCSLKRSEASMKESAARHGKEMLRLNYSLSHVVHAYGATCQAITSFAQRKRARITSEDFNTLNLCLDVAISAAVSEYQYRSNEKYEERELEHLGFLAHELRNTLSSATVAHSMIKQGLVGTGGSTSKVLEESLIRMRVLIDRSLSEVRMRSNTDLLIEKFKLNDLIDQVLLTAELVADAKKQTLASDVQNILEVEADRQLLLSIIANLIQNAIKYTKENGLILVTARSLGENLEVSVKDECGGLDENFVDNIFTPFVSGSDDKSGLGLGLTIVKRAASLLQGKISVKNSPGKGCTFILEIPKKYSYPKKQKIISKGKDSVQPK